MERFINVLPLAAVFVVCLVFLFSPAGGGAWEFTGRVLIMTAAGFMIEWRNFTWHLSLAGDALIAGCLVLVPCVSPECDVRFLVLALLIPVADVVRFACCGSLPEKTPPVSERDRNTVILEAVLIASSVIVLLVWKQMRISVAGVIYLLISAVFFIAAICIMCNARLRQSHPRETRLPGIMVFIPVTICVWGLREEEGTGNILVAVMLSLLSIAILMADRKRGQYPPGQPYEN